MSKKIDLPIPEDFETTWTLVEDTENLEYEPPFEVGTGVFRRPGPDWSDFYAARDSKGQLWYINTDEPINHDWQSHEWRRHGEPGPDQREALMKISDLLDLAKQSMNSAVEIARKAGVRLSLEREFGCQGLTNVEADGDCWETSYC